MLRGISQSQLTLIQIILSNSEAALHELVPTIDNLLSKRLARQLHSTCPELQSLDVATTDIGSLKLHLKSLSKKLFEGIKQRRHARRRRQAGLAMLGMGRTPSDGGGMVREVSNASTDSNHPAASSSQTSQDGTTTSLGQSTMSEILSVTREVRNIHRYSATWTKFSKQRLLKKSSSSSYFDDDIVDTIEVESEVDRLPASQALPRPISDVYFCVRLVDVVQSFSGRLACSCPSSRLCSSSSSRRGRVSVDCAPQDNPQDDYAKVTPNPQGQSCAVCTTEWNELLQDAKSKLSAYRAFEREHVKEGECTRFRCTGGVCFPAR